MHKGPIVLPDPIKIRCYALFNLGSLLQLFDIRLYMRVMEVRQKISNDALLVHDIQDIKLLCCSIRECSEINDLLRAEIVELNDILDLFINVASYPSRHCGMWAGVSYI